MVQDIRAHGAATQDVNALRRTSLVRVATGASTALFGGWGVRI